MDYVPEIFQHAPIGQIVESACSPVMTSEFMGLTIAAPDKIVLSGAQIAIVPLCGAFQLPAGQVIDADPMVIHVRRLVDGHIVSGMLGVAPDQLDDPDIPVPDDAIPPSAGALANTITTGWFHVDAQQWLDIDLAGGLFEFFVTYAGEKSAKQIVEILP